MTTRACPPTQEPPNVSRVLQDPSTSFWLRAALLSCLSRDPVDAANDAEVLALLLNERCRQLLQDFDTVQHQRGELGVPVERERKP